jgi:hypothetical protein
VARSPQTSQLIQQALDAMQRLLDIVRQAEQANDVPAPLPDDEFVDQHTARCPREIFLRLARKGVFPSQKHGKRVVARWGDVRLALAAQPKPQGAAAIPSDNLDDLRDQMGLARKGR